MFRMIYIEDNIIENGFIQLEHAQVENASIRWLDKINMKELTRKKGDFKQHG